jgi:thiosulfate dehydrogenase
MKKMHFILLAVLAFIMVGLVSMWFIRLQDKMAVFPTTLDSTWHGPSIYVDNTTKGEERELIIYGQDLIVHTSRYLGPKGSVAKITNGMNCQNCHLQGGAKAWGNNYAAVFSTYPKYRDRSGQNETIYKRVADCMERSLNGTPIDSNSREMAGRRCTKREKTTWVRNSKAEFS